MAEEEYSYEYAMGLPKKKGVGYWIGKVLKWLCIALIVAVYLLFMVRLISSGDPAAVKEAVRTPVLDAAIAADPSVQLLTDENVVEVFTKREYFRVNRVRVSEGAGEVQLVLRWNRSTLKYLAQNEGLDEVPTDGESFIYTLEDANGTRYTAYSFRAYKKGLHHYRVLVFDGVNVADAGTLTLNVYYAGDVSWSGDPYDTALIWDEETEHVPAALPDTVDAGFTPNPAYLVKD